MIVKGVIHLCDAYFTIYVVYGHGDRNRFFFLLSLLHLFFFRWPFLYGVFISLACNAFTCPMGYHKVLFRFSLSSLSFQTDCSVRHQSIAEIGLA